MDMAVDAKIWINDEDGSKEKAGGYSHRNEARRKKPKRG